MRNSAPVNTRSYTMPPKSKTKAPAPAARPRRTKTFRKLALAAATVAALSALFGKSRGAAKFQALGAARYRQHLADTNASSLSQSGSGWKRGDDLGLTGRKAGTGHQHALHGDVVRSKAFQEAAEGLAKDIGTSRTLKPSEKLDAVTVGEGFLRHVNPRRIKFTRPMKLLGAAAAILLALGSKGRLEGVVSRGRKSNKPFGRVYESHQGPGSFSRGVDLALGDVSGSGLAARPARSGVVSRAELGERTVKQLRALVVQHNLHNKISGCSRLRKSALITAILKHKGAPDESDEDSDDDVVPCDGGGLPKKHLQGACRGGPCDHKEKYSDVLE